MSGSNCCFLTCIQISPEADKVVWYSHLLKNFPQFVVTHTVKVFGIVNKAVVDVLWMWELDYKESWVPKNWYFWTVVGENSWESLGLQGDQTSQSYRKSILNIHWKDWCWSWNSDTLTTWCEELIHWKRSWCWERLKAGGEREDRGRDGWMATPTWWKWVWASSGNWWWTGKPGVLQSTESQSQTWLSDWTELNLTWC